LDEVALLPLRAKVGKRAYSTIRSWQETAENALCEASVIAYSIAESDMACDKLMMREASRD